MLGWICDWFEAILKLIKDICDDIFDTIFY